MLQAEHTSAVTAFHSFHLTHGIQSQQSEIARMKQLSLHEAALHKVSLTCCCAPDCFVCLVAVVGFVDFAHSCASVASSTPPSIAPPLTPPAAAEHAQKAPPP